ncbi:hypothetical protein [Bacillus sp. UNCCL81]|uniref:hypothetical protein n=1 Tax=Bacillus sp. UNCCL81 TaxID=1502755 RepID=UPI0008EBC33E|nr:hypothetical protein [Bacillus sp. UNCCL81]SFD84579.1 hypothetical protein SAMN02799633_04975 [Bacillus sp. UNCCL81]
MSNQKNLTEINDFTSGSISKIEGNIVDVVTENGVSQLIVEDTSFIWRGKRDLAVSDLKVGDFFYARGVKKDGVFNVEKLWANIVNHVGTVYTNNDKTISLDQNNDKRIKIKYDLNTEVLQPQQDNTFLKLKNVTEDHFKPGKPLYVIGLYEKDSDTIKATRMFI